MLNRRYTENEIKLVTEILKKSETTSPVELSFGYVSNTNHCEKGIIIKNAAGAIIEYIVNSDLVLTTYLTKDGLQILIKN